MAQVPPGGPSSGDGPSSQAQHRRSEVRQAVATQRAGREQGETGERRLTQQERAELRQQLRENSRPGQDGSGAGKH